MKIQYKNDKKFEKALTKNQKNYKINANKSRRNTFEKRKKEYINDKSLESVEAVHTYSAPVRRLIYSRWKSYLVKSSQQPVLSLGAEMVTSSSSVDKGICEPKCESVK